MGMKSAIIAEKKSNGVYVDTNGNTLYQIGNIDIENGQEVYTDGLYIYGREKKGTMPQVPAPQTAQIIPLWYDDDSFRFYDIAQKKIVDTGRKKKGQNTYAMLNNKDAFAFLDTSTTDYDADIDENGNIYFISNGYVTSRLSYYDERKTFSRGGMYINGKLNRPITYTSYRIGLSWGQPSQSGRYVDYEGEGATLTPEDFEVADDIADECKEAMKKVTTDWTETMRQVIINEARINNKGVYCCDADINLTLTGLAEIYRKCYTVYVTRGDETVTTSEQTEYLWGNNVPYTVSHHKRTRYQHIQYTADEYNTYLIAQIKLYQHAYIEDGEVRKEKKQINYNVAGSTDYYNCKDYNAPATYPLWPMPSEIQNDEWPAGHGHYNDYDVVDEWDYSYFSFNYNQTRVSSGHWVHLENNTYYIAYKDEVRVYLPEAVNEESGSDEDKKYIINDDFYFKNGSIYEDGKQIATIGKMNYDEFGASFSIVKVADNRYVLLLNRNLYEINNGVLQQIDTSESIRNKRINVCDSVQTFIAYADKE